MKKCKTTYYRDNIVLLRTGW